MSSFKSELISIYTVHLVYYNCINILFSLCLVLLLHLADPPHELGLLRLDLLDLLLLPFDVLVSGEQVVGQLVLLGKNIAELRVPGLVQGTIFVGSIQNGNVVLDLQVDSTALLKHNVEVGP